MCRVFVVLSCSCLYNRLTTIFGECRPPPPLCVFAGLHLWLWLRFYFCLDPFLAVMEDIIQRAMDVVLDSEFLDVRWLCIAEGTADCALKRISKLWMRIVIRSIVKDFEYRRRRWPHEPMWFYPRRFRLPDRD